MRHTNTIGNRRITKNKTIKRSSWLTPPFPIDVVYTWSGEKVTHNIRTNFNYELKYSLRSLYMFAPWVNHIFILMNPPKKTPSWLKETSKITVVDHLDTFPSTHYLPTTNSNSIETTLCNIPGLSEHFIYFNDDIFLGRKALYTDFFTRDGKARVDHGTILSKSPFINNKNSKRLTIQFPPNNALMYKHIPIPKIKSICHEFNAKYDDYIQWIRTVKKRKEKGFNMCEKNNLRAPCQQTHYPVAKYMYLKNKAVLSNDEYRMYYLNNNMTVDDGVNLTESLNNVKRLRPLFFCINDTETNHVKRKTILKIMQSFFNEYYPIKPDFEH